MGECILHGSGGSNPLNFKVVSNPQPANPKGNTIWINTDTPINGWEFVSLKPSEMGEHGKVYIVSETSANNSAADFNTLKKNGIWINPISAWQNVNGVLEQKEAKIYKGGAWVELFKYLLDGGDKCTAITGGWVNATTCKLSTGHSGTTSGEATQNADGLAFGSDNTIVNTKNKIDMTGYNTLNLNILSNNGAFIVSVRASMGGSLNESYAAYKHISGTGIISIDVSSVKGEYYIAIGQDGAYRGTVNKVWLEG